MRTKAIILKKQNTNEYDQLVTCYTEEFGKVTGIAKSILKPSSVQSMHLDTFNLVEFEFINGRAIPIITGAQAEEIFVNIKNDLPSLAVAYYFTETIDRLTFDYQKDEALWSFLVSVVNSLNNEGNDIKKFLKTKQIELLGILGYAPNLKECVFCSRTPTGVIAYNTQAKGIVCGDCFLNGGGGIVIKNDDLLSESILSSIFEALVERRIHSLNLVHTVLQ